MFMITKNKHFRKIFDRNQFLINVLTITLLRLSKFNESENCGSPNIDQNTVLRTYFSQMRIFGYHKHAGAPRNKIQRSGTVFRWSINLAHSVTLKIAKFDWFENCYRQNIGQQQILRKYFFKMIIFGYHKHVGATRITIQRPGIAFVWSINLAHSVTHYFENMIFKISSNPHPPI